MFNDLGIEVVYRIKHTFKNILGNPRDKTETFEKSGVYEINCNGSIKMYIQHRRGIKIRFGECLSNIKYG